MSQSSQVFNFSAGPAVLPVSVLEIVQQDLLNLADSGMSILEMSHRSRTVDQLLHEVEADVRTLAGIPENYSVLFLQGGASLQFSMLPMNLLSVNQPADYLVTGVWAQKAVHEAEKVGAVRIAGSTESEGFVRIPRQDELSCSPKAAYVHFTSNNTIYGTQWQDAPDVGTVPLVSDMSSDIFSRPLNIERYGFAYASAQKNLGPAGLTLVIIRNDLLERSSSSLPSVMNYATLVKHGSRYNTPPVFGIYVLHLVVRWLQEQGGLAGIARRNERKAAKVYAEIDRTEFYQGIATDDSRSLMNITFKLPTKSLDEVFSQEATKVGLLGIAGHRLLEGQRASLYNAMPENGAVMLASFMRDFERRHG